MTKSSSKYVFLHVIFMTLVIVVALTCASTAHAQYEYQPPVQSSIDHNSVNLDTGELIISSTDVSIGPNNHHGLKYTRQFVRNGTAVIWSSADVPVLLYPWTGTPIVVYEGKTYKFSYSGGVLRDIPATGATLVIRSYNSWDADAATFVSGDGTVVNFTVNYYIYGKIPGSPAGRATSIVYPDGITKTFTYKTGFDVCGSCGWMVARLSSVNLSNGYQLKFQYNRDNVPDNWSSNQEALWFQVSRVVALNNSVEYCNPAANSCTFSSSYSWPQATYAYDSSGFHVTDSENRTTDYAIDSYGRMTAVHAAGSINNNSEITYSTISGQSYKVTSVKNGGQTWTYTYDTSNSPNVITTVTDPLSHSRVVQFTGVDHLKTSDTDENGSITSYSYCASNEVDCPVNLPKVVTYPEGNARQNAYDTRGNVTRTTLIPKAGSGLSNLEATATFDPNCTNAKVCNQPTQTTGFAVSGQAGPVTNYEYDPSSGYQSKVTLPAPTTGAARPEVRTSFYTLQAWVKDSTGGLVLGPAAARYPASVSMCKSGSAPSCLGTADEAVRDLYYTSLGDLGAGNGTNVLGSGVTGRSGNNDSAQTSSTTIAYNSVGDVVRRVDGVGNAWQATYNKARQVISSWSPDPDGTGSRRPYATVYHYGANGLPDSITQGTVDAGGNNFAGIQYRYPSYDDYGRIVGERLSQGGVDYSLTQIAYDPVGRVACKALRMDPSVYPQVASYSACDQGPQGSVNPDRITHYVWEFAGGLGGIQSGYNSALQRNDVQYTHNRNGKPLAMIDPKGNVTSYAYDGHDRQLRECYNATSDACAAGSASDFVQLSYDSVGRLTNRSLRGISLSYTISYAYDDLGRVTNVAYPGGGFYDKPVSYTYDNLGRIVMAADTNAHTSTFGYDALGRVTSQGDAISTRTMQYDANGRRTRLTWPDARYVTYQYYDTGEMKTILENGSSVLATFTYDDLGRRSSLTRGNGVATTYYDYGTTPRLTCLTHNLAGGGTLACSSSSVTASGDDQATSFAYNAAGQITNRASANSAYAWTGSYNVNRIYTTNALNQYTASGAVVPTYDTKGNLTTASGTEAITPTGSPSYNYSTKNELVYRNDTGVGFYHDPLGRLDSVLGAPGGDYGFQYVGDQISDEVSFSTGNPIQSRYVFGPKADEPIVWYQGPDLSDKRYLVADERGSIVAITDASGNKIAINTYDEFGIPGTANQGRFRYTGQAWIAELGMYSYKARMYSPTMGRFLQTDPAGYPDGPNWYNYVNSDPVNKTDPSGMACGDGYSNSYCDPANPSFDGPEIVWSAPRPISGQVNWGGGFRNTSPYLTGNFGGSTPPPLTIPRNLPWRYTTAATNTVTPQQKSTWDRVMDAFCALPPLEISGGADAYLGIGASASLGISIDVRTLQFRGSVGGTLGAGFGGGLGVGAGAGATTSGYSQEVSGTLAAGPGSVTVSQGGLSAGTGPKFGPRLGVWGGVSGKYTTPATPDLTGACNVQ